MQLLPNRPSTDTSWSRSSPQAQVVDRGQNLCEQVGRRPMACLHVPWRAVELATRAAEGVIFRGSLGHVGRWRCEAGLAGATRNVERRSRLAADWWRRHPALHVRRQRRQPLVSVSEQVVDEKILAALRIRSAHHEPRCDSSTPLDPIDPAVQDLFYPAAPHAIDTREYRNSAKSPSCRQSLVLQ